MEIKNHQSVVQRSFLSFILENSALMKSCVTSACEALIAQESNLNDLDVGCGDGDTGSTLATGCNGEIGCLSWC